MELIILSRYNMKLRRLSSRMRKVAERIRAGVLWEWISKEEQCIYYAGPEWGSWNAKAVWEGGIPEWDTQRVASEIGGHSI